MRTFSHRAFSADLLAGVEGTSVSVCLPARNEARTIGPILEQLMPLHERGILDQVVVVDDSTDGTGDIARGLGAEVHDQSALVAELGPVCGKGDAMWRALSVLRGDVVCYLDADSEDFGPHFALGLIGPLLTDPAIAFVKGFYRRPVKLGETRLPDGGGRVTELMARPLLNRWFPDLVGVIQPLAGEIAARRDLLERLPFSTGYAVDIALLIDAWQAAGLDALAQVDLDVRQNQHQPLSDLGPMAAAVLAGVMSRVDAKGRFSRDQEVVPFLAPDGSGALRDRTTTLFERPPMASLRAPQPAPAPNAG